MTAQYFVLERRKGISPNIGFVSELMTFEEQELGGKSVGVMKMSGDGEGTATEGEGSGLRGISEVITQTEEVEVRGHENKNAQRRTGIFV